MRLDGYLVSDIRDCLVHTEEDILKWFRKVQNEPEFNPPAGFRGNLWFAKRGMFDISLWLIILDMTAVPLAAVAYGRVHKGNRSLSYDTGCVFLFFLIMLVLEFYPLGKIVNWIFWKHIREVLDFYGYNGRAEEENPELKKMPAEDGGSLTASSLIILGLDLLLTFFCKQVTIVILPYFSYTR